MPKNVLLLCSDQHRRDVAGCYGHPIVETPHLDSLAVRGTRFTHAYTPSPICVSARACMATGYYAHQVGAWDNAAPYTGVEATSWGHRLTAHGIRVTTIGKLHYRSQQDPTGFPDQRLPMHVKGGSGNLYGLLREEMPPLASFRTQVENAGPGISDYATYDAQVARAAVHWLHEEADTQTPWALKVSFANPHPPFLAPTEFAERYAPNEVPLPANWQAADWPHHPAIDWLRRQQKIDTPFDETIVRRAIATYFGMVSYVDSLIGDVLNALDATGQTNETLVIYTSDHGEMLGEKGLWFKCCMYEASVGIPFIMAGPGVPRGDVCKAPCSLVDLYPTLLEAFDISAPTDEPPRPGESLLSLAGTPARQRSIFSEFHGALSRSAVAMLRTDRWKFIDYANATPQLFDVQQDPHEQVDLAENADYAELIAGLSAELQTIADPNVLDQRAKADQHRRLEAAGGRDRLLAEGFTTAYTPPPMRGTTTS